MMLDSGSLGSALPGEFEPVVDSLLAKITEDRPTFENLQSVPLDPGHSGAKVFLVTAHSHGTPDIPLIVKAGPRSLIETEAGNYRGYVEGKLRTAPRLSAGPVVTEDLAAIAYEIAGTVQSINQLLSLKDYIERNLRSWKWVDNLDPPFLDPVLCDLKSWWTGCRQVDHTVFDLYPLNGSDVQALGLAFDEVTRSSLGKRFLEGPIRNPAESWPSWRRRWPQKTTFESIVHGDLNLRNILVDKSTRRTHLIDFAMVQPSGHVFRDLAKLLREICLRAHTPMATRTIEQFFWEQRELSKLVILLLSGKGDSSDSDFARNFETNSIHFKPLKGLVYHVIQESHEIMNKWTALNLASLDVLVALQALHWFALFRTEDYSGQHVAAVNSCIAIGKAVEEILADFAPHSRRRRS